jgi:hypothetical protein
MWTLREGNHWTQTPYWQPNLEVIKLYFNLCICNWLHCYGWEVMNYPPYSTHLKPSHLYLYVLFRKHLANKWFATDTDIKEVFISLLQTLETNFFHTGIQALVLCWDKCFNDNSDYVEVSGVANVIQTPCIFQSQNKGLRTLPYYVKFLCILLPVMLYNTYMIAQCNDWMNYWMIFKQAW